MSEGTIKKLTDKGFGFIDSGQGDLFFHVSGLENTTFDELYEGQRVEYTEEAGDKGPRATHIRAL